MKLEEVRKEIDQIDGQMLELFLRRMDAAAQVARIKAQTGQPVYHQQREQEILNDVTKKAGAYAAPAKILFQTMMDVSRALQQNLLGGGKELLEQIEHADTAPLLGRTDAVIACPGTKGSFSSLAAKKLFPNSPLVFYPRFYDVFDAVKKGEATFGVVPVENSTAGSVEEVYDLLLKHRFFIAGEEMLPIDHCLCGVPGTTLSSIRRIYSHPQGLNQCRGIIDACSAEAVACDNTAIAADRVAKEEDPINAAICSAQAAKKNGLVILKKQAQDIGGNTTRFIVISRTLIIEPEADKISLSFSLPHVTGSLHRTLSRFAACGLNLTKIESRPMENSRFEYLFYLDFTGSARAKDTLSLLCALSGDLPEFTFLGNYAARRESSETADV